MLFAVFGQNERTNPHLITSNYNIFTNSFQFIFKSFIMFVKYDRFWLLNFALFVILTISVVILHKFFCFITTISQIILVYSLILIINEMLQLFLNRIHTISVGIQI